MARGGSGGISQFIELIGDEKVRRAFEQLGASGESAFRRINEAANRNAAALQGAGTAAEQSAKSMNVLGSSLTNVQTGMTTLMATAKGLGAAFAAIGATQAARAVADTVDKVAKRNKELRNTADLVGAEAGDVKVITEAIEGTGESTDGARQAMAVFADKLADARIKFKDLNSQVKVFRGDQGFDSDLQKKTKAIEDWIRGIKIMQGDKSTGTGPPALADIVETLQAKMAKFPATTEGFRNAVKGLLSDLDKISAKDKAIGTAVGAEFFGRQYKTIAAGLKKLAESGEWDKIAENLKATERWPTPEQNAAVDAYIDSWDEVGDKIEEMQNRWSFATGAVSGGVGNVTAAVLGLGNEMDKSLIQGAKRVSETVASEWEKVKTAFTTGNWAEFHQQQMAQIQAIWGGLSTWFTETLGPALNAAWGTVLGWMSEGLSAWVTGATETMTEYTKSIESLFASMWESIKSAAQSALDAIKAGIATISENAAITGGALHYASGGIVPGVGTGDTVAARLTPGEFVMRRAAVEKFGLGLMQSLNGLQTSLLPRTRYATGGLVTAKTPDGTTVNLHFPGGTFALRGDKGIVQGLTREARRASMLSAGRLPGVAVT